MVVYNSRYYERKHVINPEGGLKAVKMQEVDHWNTATEIIKRLFDTVQGHISQPKKLFTMDSMFLPTGVYMQMKSSAVSDTVWKWCNDHCTCNGFCLSQQMLKTLRIPVKLQIPNHKHYLFELEKCFCVSLKRDYDYINTSIQLLLYTMVNTGKQHGLERICGENIPEIISLDKPGFSYYPEQVYCPNNIKLSQRFTHALCFFVKSVRPYEVFKIFGRTKAMGMLTDWFSGQFEFCNHLRTIQCSRVTFWNGNILPNKLCSSAEALSGKDTYLQWECFPSYSTKLNFNYGVLEKPTDKEITSNLCKALMENSSYDVKNDKNDGNSQKQSSVADHLTIIHDDDTSSFDENMTDKSKTRKEDQECEVEIKEIDETGNIDEEDDLTAEDILENREIFESGPFPGVLNDKSIIIPNNKDLTELCFWQNNLFKGDNFSESVQQEEAMDDKVIKKCQSDLHKFGQEDRTYDYSGHLKDDQFHKDKKVLEKVKPYIITPEAQEEENYNDMQKDIDSQDSNEETWSQLHQEESFDAEKNKPSFLKEHYKKICLIHDCLPSGSYSCVTAASEEVELLSKEEKDIKNRKQKETAALLQQSGSKHYDQSSSEKYSCCLESLEEIRRFNESLQKELKEITNALAVLRKEFFMKKLRYSKYDAKRSVQTGFRVQGSTTEKSKNSNTDQKSTLSNVQSDDKNCSHLSVFKRDRMDYNTLLETLPDSDSELTEVKEPNYHSQTQSMLQLKLPLCLEEQLEGKSCEVKEEDIFSSGGKMNLLGTDDFDSFYPETFSDFQGRSRDLNMYDSSVVSTQPNTVSSCYSNNDCESYENERCDDRLLPKSTNYVDHNAVLNSLDHETNRSKNGIVIDENETIFIDKSVEHGLLDKTANRYDNATFSYQNKIEDTEMFEAPEVASFSNPPLSISFTESNTCSEVPVEKQKTDNSSSIANNVLNKESAEIETTAMLQHGEQQNQLELRGEDTIKEREGEDDIKRIIKNVKHDIDEIQTHEKHFEYSEDVLFYEEVMEEIDKILEMYKLQKNKNDSYEAASIRIGGSTAIINADQETDKCREYDEPTVRELPTNCGSEPTDCVKTSVYAEDRDESLSNILKSDHTEKEHCEDMSENQNISCEGENYKEGEKYSLSRKCSPYDSYEGLDDYDTNFQESFQMFVPAVVNSSQKNKSRRNIPWKTKRLSSYPSAESSDMAESGSYHGDSEVLKHKRKNIRNCHTLNKSRARRNLYTDHLGAYARKKPTKEEIALAYGMNGKGMNRKNILSKSNNSVNPIGFAKRSAKRSITKNSDLSSVTKTDQKSFHEMDVRREFGNTYNLTEPGQIIGNLHCQTLETFDSGIYSSLMSVRSSILKEYDSYKRSLSSKVNKKKKRSRNNFRELQRLESDLSSFLGSLERIVSRGATYNAVVFPGLQQYFSSLNSGQTLSFQERMQYEWLRLMSFSTYTGEGSPVHLARSGFYHSHNNETHCFCCNTSHSMWAYTDNVREVHRRISPNCPLVTGGIESNGNISIESGTREVQPNIANGVGIATGMSQPSYGPERRALPGSNGQFALRTDPRPNVGSPATGTAAVPDPSFSFCEAPIRQNPTDFSFPQTSSQETSQGSTPNQANQSAATAVTSLIPTFNFNQATNTPVPTGLNTSQQTDLSTRLQALTVQQSVSGQQPSDEPISGNPVIAPTQPQQIPRQSDGEAQLSISSQLPPQLTDQHTSTENQGSETTGSAQRENADLIEVTQLKHPRYSTMAVRMSSFRSWPSYLNQTARQMAYAGFFHPGVADFARCFCCGGGLRNWEADDDPMVEHARWYPRCEYINKLKGTHFVQAVLRRHREHMAERQREQEAIQTTYSTPDPMTTTVAAGLLEMGFTEERAREAILTVRRLRGRSEVSIEEVTAWMLDDESAQNQDLPARVGNAPPVSYRSATPPASNSSSFESAAAARQNSDGSGSLGSAGESQGASGGDKKEDKPPTNISSKEDSSDDEKGMSGKENESSDDKAKKGKELDEKKAMSKKGKKSKSRKGKSPGEEATGPLHNDVDTKSLKEENKLLKQMQVCKICMDKYVSVTFLPCGHLVCCEDCAKSMRKCPICRKRIKGQVRTYMS